MSCTPQTPPTLPTTRRDSLDHHRTRLHTQHQEQARQNFHHYLLEYRAQLLYAPAPEKDDTTPPPAATVRANRLDSLTHHRARLQRARLQRLDRGDGAEERARLALCRVPCYSAPEGGVWDGVVGGNDDDDDDDDACGEGYDDETASMAPMSPLALCRLDCGEGRLMGGVQRKGGRGGRGFRGFKRFFGRRG